MGNDEKETYVILKSKKLVELLGYGNLKWIVFIGAMDTREEG